MDLAFDARHLSLPYSGLGRFTHKLLESALDIPWISKFTVLLDQKTNISADLATKIHSRAAVVVRLNAPLKGIAHHIEVSRYVNSQRFDCYFYPHFDLPFFVRTPSRFVVHDVLPLIFPGYIKNWELLKKLYFKGAISYNLFRGRSLFVVSATTKSDLLARVPLAARREAQIQICYEGPTLNLSKSPPERPHPKPYVLYVGDRRPHKNLKRAIDIFLRLRAHGAYTGDFVIIGNRTNYDFDLDSYVQNNSAIVILGSCSEEVLGAYYQHCDALYFFSLYEGFGLPIVDAALFGRKIITSTGGALTEVAPNGALLLDPNEDDASLVPQVGRYLSSPPMITPNQEYFHRFSWKSAAEIIFSER